MLRKPKDCGIICAVMDNNPAPLTGISLAMYQPDMPQNVGAMMRLCACLNVPLHIAEPCGFIWKEKEFKRAGMDYTTMVSCTRHTSWDALRHALAGRRFVLLTTKASVPMTEFEFRPGDILVTGRESAGVPQDVHESIPHRIRIPMHGDARSLNVVNAAAIVLGEALRQTGGFPAAS